VSGTVDNNRSGWIHEIERLIGRRRLLWFGTRGTDALPLLSLRQFSGVFSLVAPLGLASWNDSQETCLELLSGRRVDLNSYTIDEDSSSEARELHRRLVAALEPGTVLAPYRPCVFLSSAYFPRMEFTTYLGMFIGQQAAYEHKPWVESELARVGLPIIPWRYFLDEDGPVLAEWMEGRAMVLRANYSDGGRGLTMVQANDDPRLHLPPHTEGFLAAAPFLHPNVPLNVSGCVFPDGTVTVHGPSLQLIGISACTTRPFGYCGNDFAAVGAALDKEALGQLERLVVDTGRWLHTTGYRGAFGLDALYYEGSIWLTEVNPRFQGSSAAAARVANRTGLPDVYLDHLAAFLGATPSQQRPSLAEVADLQTEEGARASQIVCYNIGEPRRLRQDVVVPEPDSGTLHGIPDDDVVVETEGMLFKLLVDQPVTRDGFSLSEDVGRTVRDLNHGLFEVAF
jgi:hypothetical protein